MLTAANTTINGDTNSDGKPDVGIVPPATKVALRVESDHNLIRNLAIQGLALAAESSAYNTVTGCYLGTNVAGRQALGLESDGVEMKEGAHHNIVENCVIAGNAGNNPDFSSIGVAIWAGAHDNVVRGNRIGINVDGEALPNEYGVTIGNGPWCSGGEPFGNVSGNLIGGSHSDGACDGACNTIGGNLRFGVILYGSQAVTNTVAGNFIGLTTSGTGARPNLLSGVMVQHGARHNVIGGARSAPFTCGGECNAIGANEEAGVGLAEAGTTDNRVQGNNIGFGPDGNHQMANGLSGVYLWQGAAGNLIGGRPGGSAFTGPSNLIGGNAEAGVLLRSTGTVTNAVEGNVVEANAEGGIIALDGASDNRVGAERAAGTCSGPCNLISHNGFFGIAVDGAASHHNAIRGNEFHDNEGRAIELLPQGGIGVAATGANDGRSAPALFLREANGRQRGSVDAPDGSVVELYSTAGALLKSATVSGKLFSADLGTGVAGPVMAAVTDPAGSTSEFSIPGALTLIAPYALPSGRVYAFGVLTDTVSGTALHTAGPAIVAAGTHTFTLTNQGGMGDFKGGDVYYSGWFTAPAAAGDYPVTLSITRTGSVAVTLHVVTTPTLAVLTDLEELRNEFARTDDAARPGFYPDLYRALTQLAAYAGRHTGFLADLKQEVHQTSLTDPIPYRLFVYGADNGSDSDVRRRMGTAIDNYMATLRPYATTLRYAAIVGDDAVVPSFRRADPTVAEHDYISVTQMGPPLGSAALYDSGQDLILTDVPYGSFDAADPDTVRQPPNDLAVGRIYYPTPAALARAFDLYETPLAIDETATAAGLHLANERKLKWEQCFDMAIVPPVKSVFDPTILMTSLTIAPPAQSGAFYRFDGRLLGWTRGSVSNALSNANLGILYSHSNHTYNTVQWSAGFTGQDLGALPEMPGRLVVNAGCHSGYSVARQASAGAPAYYTRALVTNALGRYLAWLAPTTYGLGANESLEYHDRFFKLFLDSALGSASTVGQALRDAARRYDHESCSLIVLCSNAWDDTDTYIRYGLAYYGLPTQPIAGRGKEAQVAPPDARPAAAVSSYVLNVVVDTPNFHPVTNADGTVRFELPNTGALGGTARYPLLPQVTRLFRLPAGATVTGVQLVDQASALYPGTVSPEILTAVNRTFGPRPGAEPLTAPFPASLYSTSTTPLDGDVLLTVVANPMRYDPTTRRATLYSHLALRVTYDAPASGLAVTGLLVNGGAPVTAGQASLPLQATLQSAGPRPAVLSWWMIDVAGGQLAAGQQDVALAAGANTVNWTGDTLGWHPGPVQLLVTVGDAARAAASGETSFVVQGRSLVAETDAPFYGVQPSAALKVTVFDQAGAGVTGLAGSLVATLDGAPLALTWIAAGPGEYGAQVPLAGVAEGRHVVQVQAPGAPPAITGFGVDRTPPTATVDRLPPQNGALAIPVSLSGEDEVAGVDYYELQYTMDGLDYWVDWMTHTAALDYYPGGATIQFGPAQAGRTYSFRARATDRAGNAGSYPPGEGQARTKVVIPDYAQQVVELTNLERARQWLPPLQVQPNLTAAAAWMAQDMADYGYMNDDHSDRLGRSADERILAFGYSPRYVTRENIGRGGLVPGDAVTGWINSPGHRANILATDINEIGAGYGYNAADPFVHYWVQDFGSRTGVYPVIVNEDAARTFSSDVRLYIYGQGWAQDVRLSNDGHVWTAWEPYQPQRSWTLAPGAGMRTVRVQLRRSGLILNAEDSIEVVPALTPTPGNGWAWGDNQDGQLGNGDSGQLVMSLTPTRTAVLGDLVAVSAGTWHSLGVRSDGTVWAWGGNSAGQLGDGTYDSHATPVQVPGLSGVQAVAAGYEYSLALRSDGTVWAWGANGAGQLGDGTYTGRATPALVPGLASVRAIAAGAEHSLAVKNDGTVWAWGANAFGQLGDGTNTGRPSPVRATGLGGAKAAAAGSTFSLALRTDGAVWSWGGNLNGSLGNGTQNDSPWPAPIPGLSHVVAVSAGLLHGLALQDNGTVWAWGYNQEGELGRPTDLQCWCSPSLGCYTCSLTPLATLGGATAVAAGSRHSVAVADGGSLLACGGNDRGQLGDGTHTRRPAPVAVPGFGGITALAAGAGHTLVVSSWTGTWTPPATEEPLPIAPPQPLPVQVSESPWLVKDINPDLDPAAGSWPAVLTPAGSRLYFSAVRDAEGRELWVSDGTAGAWAPQGGAQEGTHLVDDVRPGLADAGPRMLVWADNLLFFSAHDGSSGRELWRSDGTAAGTFLLQDIFCYDPEENEFAVNRRGPEKLTAVGGTLFFTANDSCYDDQWSETRANWELWMSDGTQAGTVQVKDIAVPSGGYYNSSSPANLTNVNGTLFFTARDWNWPDEQHPGMWSRGRELWKSDGSEEGTVCVKDVNPGNQGSDPTYLTAVGSTLYFAADDSEHGWELWKSDGTAAGTVLVKDIIAGPDPHYSGPASLTAVGSTLFFRASDGTSGMELWKSDGTAAGTVLVKDITPGTGGTPLAAMTNVNGTLFFVANSLTGSRLWKSNGTAAGTVEVKGPFPYPPTCPVVMGNKLYFVAAADAAFPRLWVSDGTAAGTTVVKDVPIYPQDAQNGVCLVALNNTLYFQSAGDGVLGAELWKSDGTAAGTVPVGDLHPGPQSATRGLDAPLVQGNGPLLLAASEHLTDTELWVSDGTDAGTVRLKDANPGPAGSNPAALTTLDRITYFSADDGQFGRELWRTCSTPDTTARLRNLSRLESGSDPDQFTPAGDITFFAASDLEHGRELWKTDDSWPGTALVRDIRPGLEDSYPRSLVVLDGTLYFFANSSEAEPCALWKSDGTAGGTVQVKGWPGCGTADPQALVRNGLIYFIMQDELWSSDGTAAGTQLRVSLDYVELDALAATPSRLFLHGIMTSYMGVRPGLWASDGTQAGTVELTTCAKPAAMLPLGDRLLFVGRPDDGWWPYQKGWELCVTNGTPAGTTLLKDINPGAAGSLPHELTRMSEQVAVFAASDGQTGVEVWQTDGTAAGTVRLTDVAAGPRSANPRGFSVAGPVLFFWADDGLHGEELWAMPAPGGTVELRRVYLPLVVRAYRAQ